MTDDEIKKQVREAVAFLHGVFTEGEGVSGNTGHSLAMKILMAATVEGATRGEAKALYRSGTTDERRDAAGVMVLMSKMLEQVIPLITKISEELGDDFVKRVCACGNCEGPDVIHLPVPAADSILAEMPDALAKVIRDLIDNHGLTISTTHSDDNFGFIELGGDEKAVKAAQKALADSVATGPVLPASIADNLSMVATLAMATTFAAVPQGIIDEIAKQEVTPTDDHTSEISRALDKMGDKRPRLSRSDVPKPH